MCGFRKYPYPPPYRRDFHLTLPPLWKFKKKSVHFLKILCSLRAPILQEFPISSLGKGGGRGGYGFFLEPHDAHLLIQFLFMTFGDLKNIHPYLYQKQLFSRKYKYKQKIQISAQFIIIVARPLKFTFHVLGAFTAVLKYPILSIYLWMGNCIYPLWNCTWSFPIYFVIVGVPN